MLETSELNLKVVSCISACGIEWSYIFKCFIQSRGGKILYTTSHIDQSLDLDSVDMHNILFVGCC